MSRPRSILVAGEGQRHFRRDETIGKRQRLLRRANEKHAPGHKKVCDNSQGLLLGRAIEVNQQIATENIIIDRLRSTEVFSQKIFHAKTDAFSNHGIQYVTLADRLKIPVAKT